MIRRMLKLFCLLALGLAFFDIAVDTVACESGETAVECHACLCCAHVAPSVDVEVVRVSLPPTHVVCTPPLYAHLVYTAIFHPPPRLAA